MTTSYHTMQISANPSDDEAAAIVAAIAGLLGGGEQPAAEPATGWRSSVALISQGIAPARTPAAPRWATIERIRRAGPGGSGITGL